MEKGIKRAGGTINQAKTVQVPKPLFKFSTTPKTVSVKPKIESDVIMEMDNNSEEETSIGGIKRKHDDDEDDDFEVV